jgi:hypothetical protein
MADFKAVVTPHGSSGEDHGALPQTLAAQLQKLTQPYENLNEHDLVSCEHVVREYADALIKRSDWIMNGEALHKPRTIGDPNTFLEVLQDTANYQDNELLMHSFHALHRLFHQTEAVFSLITRAQVLIVDDSIQLSRYLRENMPMLRDIGGGIISTVEME